MKVAKITLFAFLVALVAVGVSTTAYSFHSGGVAECEGCHSMHSPKARRSELPAGRRRPELNVPDLPREAPHCPVITSAHPRRH